MAKNDNLTDFLTDVANAIRVKKGMTAKINPQDFSSEIASISAGGECDRHDWLNDVTQKDVNFYDYDGRRLYSYSWEEAVALTELPPLPTRKGLVCQGWNYTLDDIKNQSHHKCDIGANYITDDGKTRIYHETTVDNTSVTIGYQDNASNNNKPEVIVDWGDGNTSIHSGSGNAKESHTYTKAGVYMITLEVPEEHGNSQFEQFSGSKLIKVEMGARMDAIRSSATSYQRYIRAISVTKDIRYLHYNNVGVFAYDSRIEALIFPRECNVQCTWLAMDSGVKVVSLPPTATSLSEMFMFTRCNQLYSIVIPQNVTSIGERTFLECTNLSDVALPNSITSIYAGAFFGCSSLKKLVLSHFNAIPSISDYQYKALPDECTSIYVPASLYDEWKTRWSSYASRIIMDFTPTDCIELSITADDAIGRQTTATIYYTATCNGNRISSGKSAIDTVKGTSVSSEFPQNTSYTDSVTREISFTYLGVTATTTITQGVWVDAGYTVDLNGGQWELNDTPANPDAALYDGVYRSVLSKGVNNGVDTMYIDIVGYNSFKLYIRSYAEGNFDYVMVSQLDKAITGSTSATDSTLVKASTKGKQSSNTGINGYTLVEFTGIDGGNHRITIVYRKDGSGNTGDDRGYVLIPKGQ